MCCRAGDLESRRRRLVQCDDTTCVMKCSWTEAREEHPTGQVQNEAGPYRQRGHYGDQQ